MNWVMQLHSNDSSDSNAFRISKKCEYFGLAALDDSWGELRCTTSAITYSIYCRYIYTCLWNHILHVSQSRLVFNRAQDPSGQYALHWIWQILIERSAQAVSASLLQIGSCYFCYCWFSCKCQIAGSVDFVSRLWQLIERIVVHRHTYIHIYTYIYMRP